MSRPVNDPLTEQELAALRAMAAELEGGPTEDGHCHGPHEEGEAVSLSWAEDILCAGCQESALGLLPRLLRQLDAPLGCADHSCDIAPPKGMGTNGHCRCDEQTLRRAVRKMRAEIARLTAEIAAAQAAR